MKRAIIFHGTDEKPENYWYKWLASRLEARGYETKVPAYPDMNHEDISTFLLKVIKNNTFDERTVLIGHSSGSPLILSILENITSVIPQAVLVAGYCQQLEHTKTLDPILQKSYDWDRIRSHVKDIYFINSVNDPWGCNDKQGRIMFDRLGGTQIICSEGHFGSGMFNQPYLRFELLDRLISF